MTKITMREAISHAIWEEMDRFFSRPRTRCVMADVAHAIHSDDSLPLLPQRSQTLVSPPPGDMPLPAAYQGLLTYRASGEPGRAA